MELVARDVAVSGTYGPLLRPTSLRVRSGQLLVVTTEPGAGHTALALALSGRLRPSEGTVRMNNSPSRAALQRGISLVDAPEVTEPEDSLPLSEVVAEGLSLAGKRHGRRAVRKWLSRHGFGDLASTRFENVPAEARTKLLVELAATRRGVTALVLDCPDRHGGDPFAWHALATWHAQRGLAVVVLCTPISAEKLGVEHVAIGAPKTVHNGT